MPKTPYPVAGKDSIPILWTGFAEGDYEASLYVSPFSVGAGHHGRFAQANPKGRGGFLVSWLLNNI